MATWREWSQGPLVRRIRYRIGQFLTSLWPRVAADERSVLDLWLPPRAGELFRHMAPRDQRHSLDVFYTLRHAGYDEPDLLAAALLHDVGKTAGNGRSLRLWHRPIVVLAEALAPDLTTRLASDRPQSWRYPFYLHLQHPQLGATLALQAGCSPLTAALISRHQRKLAEPPADEEDRLLAALQAADDVN